MSINDEEIEAIAERAAQKAVHQIDIDGIAERAAERALDIVYIEVGKGVLRKMAWFTGIVLMGLFAWLGTKGLLK